MLDHNRSNGHPCLVLNFIAKASRVSPLDKMITLSTEVYAFYHFYYFIDCFVFFFFIRNGR